jgi:hypothetical protein
MKLNIYLSIEPDRIGNYALGTHDGEEAEKWLKNAALELFVNKLKLSEEIPSFSSIETIDGFRFTNGSNLHLVQDEHFGVQIESSDRDALLEVKKMLEEIRDKSVR